MVDICHHADLEIKGKHRHTQTFNILFWMKMKPKLCPPVYYGLRKTGTHIHCWVKRFDRNWADRRPPSHHLHQSSKNVTYTAPVWFRRGSCCWCVVCPEVIVSRRECLECPGQKLKLANRPSQTASYICCCTCSEQFIQHPNVTSRYNLIMIFYLLTNTERTI